MNREQYRKKAYELGFAYERDYHGCAQSTIAAVQDALGLRNDFIFKSASGLAGGCGLFGDGMCGGYTRGAMLLSSFFGRRRSRFDNDKEYKDGTNLVIKELRAHFMDEYGSVICGGVQKKLFGRSYNLLDMKEREIFEKDGAHTDKCTSVVGNSSAWVVEILIEQIAQRGMKLEDFQHMIHVSSVMV
jgi:hypothetical protein